MQAIIAILTILGLVVLLSTGGLWLFRPAMRPQLERSAWFAFAPLVYGLIGVTVIVIVTLFGDANTVTPGLASSGAVTLFNLYNGYRSVEAYYKRRRQ